MISKAASTAFFRAQSTISFRFGVVESNDFYACVMLFTVFPIAQSWIKLSNALLALPRVNGAVTAPWCRRPAGSFTMRQDTEVRILGCAHDHSLLSLSSRGTTSASCLQGIASDYVDRVRGEYHDKFQF